MEEKFKKIKEAVKKELSGSCSAHQMDHIVRVYNLSLKLAQKERVDLGVLKAAALLHDIARVKEDSDSTGKTDHAILGSQMAKPILKKLGFSQDKIKHIQSCIVSHRYRTGNEPETIEAKILFDADKLDAMGAIGLARAFVWVGRNSAKIYSKPDFKKYIKNNLGGSVSGRIKNKTKHSPQIEFKTKLKLLKNKLYTKKAKEFARERTEYFEKFLNRLEKEINGDI